MNGDLNYVEPYWLREKTKDKTEQQEFVIVAASVELKSLEDFLKSQGVEASLVSTPLANIFEFHLSATAEKAWGLFQQLRVMADESCFDIVVVPKSSRKKQLLVCDMDSTIVTSETLDDIADHVGIGQQVSEITDRAMRGELEFRQALEERVGLLKGVSLSVFNEVADSLAYSEGAEQLLKVAKQNNMKTVLVSGGFEPVVKVVAEQLGFDRYVCNRINDIDGKLDGSVAEPIVDASTKLAVLNEEVNLLGINPSDSCSLGDGANDLPMLKAAGLGFAYRAKPLVRETISYQINTADLDFVLQVMGITEE